TSTAPPHISPLSLHDALPICRATVVAQGGGHAYLGMGSGLLVADVSDPTAPRELATIPLPVNAAGLALSSGWLYVADFEHGIPPDRKSTRLNSSHSQISYAVF